ncbi:MAG: helicase [Hyphomicrobiaceae bacterium]|nr:helicase [Hyphomicrobiaceae bacterium]
MGSDLEARIRHVTAVLGPTNTGKTHLAIERMLGHDSGMIGLPLRLLAREIYDKVASRVGADKVALITGEEKIRPERARYWIATVEAMPRDIDVDFLAVDEIQLCADPERGHVFTDRLLHARGRQETFLLGAQTMREAISDLIPGANFVSRPRLSKLTYAGEKKITRLPARTAVVAFSANEVYAIAELMRRQRGGAAVVMGALSPRTRNAQVELYQSGDVDFLVATDAVGMGLNLDVDHVAFAAVRKFDGQNHRNLTPSELGQIAGRAGRHMNDGTFGVTAGVNGLDNEMVERLENHNFESVRTLQWRSRTLDFSSLDGLRESLRQIPNEVRLSRARMADDVEALEALARDPEVVDKTKGPAAVSLLWDVCQLPDYRKISATAHADLVSTVFKFLRSADERIPEDWFAKQVQFADRTDGDIDTLANRIAHIRTWTFVANRSNWLKDPGHWQQRTRVIEDQLSDALHECLTQRFVDRRTSALMKGMRDKEELNAEIRDDGAIEVENHFVGRLKGFQFWPDTNAEDIHGKATRHAAAQVLSRELAMRARRVAAAKADAFKISRNGRILWRDEEIAKLEPTEDVLKPTVVLMVDEHLSPPDREKVQARLDQWISEAVGERLKPLVDLGKAEDIAGLARGIAFRLQESLGILRREVVAEEIKSLDQPARAGLRKHGVRFGAFHIYIPQLLKPACADLTLSLWALKHAGEHGLSLEALPEPPRPGLTSVIADPQVPEAFYRAYGFHVCGPRAVRIDILERLADIIRPLLAWRPGPAGSEPPNGATGDGGFTITPEMMSILGCSVDELGQVLKALGFWLERKPVPKPVQQAVAATEPAAEAPAVAAPEDAAPGTVVEAAASDGASPAVETAEPQATQSEEKPVAAAEAEHEPAKPEDATAANSAPLAELEPNAAPAVEVAAEAATEAVETPTASEPQFIDVWRPRRHKSERDQRERRRGRRGGRPQQGHGTTRVGSGESIVVAPSAVAGDAPTSSPDATAGAGAEAGDGARQGRDNDQRRSARPGRGQGRDQRRGDRDGGKAEGQGPGQRREGQGPRPGGKGQGPRHGGKQDRDNRGERRRDEPRRPQVISAGPRKSATADPDSPFAALGALKEALEKKSKERAP